VTQSKTMHCQLMTNLLTVWHYRSYNRRTSWWNIDGSVRAVSHEVDEWLADHWRISRACCGSYRVSVHLLARPRQPYSPWTRIHQRVYNSNNISWDKNWYYKECLKQHSLLYKKCLHVQTVVRKLWLISYLCILWTCDLELWTSKFCCLVVMWPTYQSAVSFLRLLFPSLGQVGNRQTVGQRLV